MGSGLTLLGARLSSQNRAGLSRPPVTVKHLSPCTRACVCSRLAGTSLIRLKSCPKLFPVIAFKHPEPCAVPEVITLGGVGDLGASRHREHRLQLHRPQRMPRRSRLCMDAPWPVPQQVSTAPHPAHIELLTQTQGVQGRSPNQLADVQEIPLCANPNADKPLTHSPSAFSGPLKSL